MSWRCYGLSSYACPPQTIYNIVDSTGTYYFSQRTLKFLALVLLDYRAPHQTAHAIGPAVRADFRRLYPANAKTPTCRPSDDNRTKVTNSVTSARSLWWHVGPYFWPADLTRTANPISGIYGIIYMYRPCTMYIYIYMQAVCMTSYVRTIIMYDLCIIMLLNGHRVYINKVS